MGMNSGDGYYQDVDEARGDLEEFEIREHDRQFDRQRDGMLRRFHDNGQAQIGATIECANCGRKIVKTSYQQKFCPPIQKGKRKSYRCKDRFNNIINPRGKFAHLGEDEE